MSYNKEDYIRIKREFSQKYLAAQSAAKERSLELYAKIPEVRQLDAVLGRTGMDIMAVVTAGGDTEAKLSEIRHRNDQLLEARKQLLVAAGYPEDYSDIRYSCEKCGDTGFVDTKMCDCMKRALVEAGYESSGLGALIRSQSFDNFSLDYYRTGGANEESMRMASEGLRRFAEQFSKDTYRNYLLIGSTGLGKTHLSTSVAKVVIERGFDVAYVTAVGMFGDFNAKQFDKGAGMKNDPDRYFEAELLIIDDLGTEMTNQFTVSCLYDLINHRINNRLSTFINTNLSFRELESRYSERITSRILGEFHPILFAGQDVRRQKIQKQANTALS